MAQSLRDEVVSLVIRKLHLAEGSLLIPDVEMTVDEVGEGIKNFLNRTDIPAQLKYAWMRIAVGVLKQELKNDETIASLNPTAVKSVTDAETKVDFDTSLSVDSAAAISSAIRNLDAELLPFRVLRMPGGCGLC